MEAGYIELSWAKGLPRNAKLHDVGDIDASFDDFGFVDRLIINQTTGHLVGGHGRIEALVKRKKEGKEPPDGIVRMADGEWQVPCDWIECEAAKEDALALRLNISQMRGGEFDLEATLKQFDGAMLYDVLQESGAALAGLNDEALKVLAAQLYPPKVEDAEPQIDRAAELQKKWNTARGQVWKLGEHRLMCGDSTSKEDVEKLMGGEDATFSFTDPPYNVGITYTAQTNDEKTREEFILWCKAWLPTLPRSFCLTVGVKRLLWWAEICGDPQWIISWVKMNGQSNTGLGGTNKWDPILVYGCVRDNQTDIIEVNNDYSEKLVSGGNHPTPKPVKLWLEIIERFSGVSDIVFEPFSGTGTTIIACEKLNRKCRAMEIAPKYVAVALERWSVATGKTPELMADGG